MKTDPYVNVRPNSFSLTSSNKKRVGELSSALGVGRSAVVRRLIELAQLERGQDGQVRLTLATEDVQEVRS